MNMNWNLNEKENILTIALEGNIDSSNAAQVEESVMELHKQNAGAVIVLDAAKLNYISSAGLRVILKVRKLQSQLSVLNVSADVYEIFQMTGFSEMMDIRKALREISVEGCEIIGTGGHGKVYRLNGDTIVKLFHPGTAIEELEREREYAKKAFVMGIPTAIPFDVVTCGDCYGLVFELINAETLTEFLKKNPDRFEEFAVKYAKLLKLLHSTKVSKDMLSSTKELYRERIAHIGTLGFFTEQEIQDLHRINDAFEDDTCIIHGDFHPKNMMVMDDELILIDMADITYGNMLYDIGSMLLTHVTVSPERMLQIVGLPVETVSRLWKIFISVYLETTDPKTIELTMKKAGIFAMLKTAAAMGFSHNANQTELIKTLTMMTRTKLLSNVEGCIALLKM